MTNNTSDTKITLDFDRDSSLKELMAHLCLKQNNIPSLTSSSDDILVDFSIHEGELERAEPVLLGCK